MTYSVYQAASGDNAVLVYSGLSNVFSTLLSGLTPGGVYRFSIETATYAGSSESTAAMVAMPTATPLSPPAPKTVTAISSTEIQVTWDPVVTSLGNIDQYRVLVLGGPQEVIERGVGLSSEAVVSGLSPYTEYTVRIRACISGATNGCGTGTAATVITKEAAPQGQLPPILTAQGPRSIGIAWSPPEFTNGVITGFSIHQRKVGALMQLLINHVVGDVLSFTHSGPDLLSYMEYEYTVTAVNAKGSVQSSWATIRTLEDVPQQLSDPSVQSLGAFSVSITWTSPILANGVITAYKVKYTEEVNDPTIVLSPKYVTIKFDVYSVIVGGLTPFTRYLFKLAAINSVGNVTSLGVTVTTGESSPAGLGLFMVEKISTGQAVILRWPAPLKPYGIITTYRIYELGVDGSIYQGLNQVFEMRRLLPYTVYSITLESCTVVGCTKGSRQSFTTAEILPAAQQPPAIGSMNATHVTLTWAPPANPNGQILSYEVLRRSNSRIQKRSLTEPVVVYKTTNTTLNLYQFVDSGLQPYTEYQYLIRAGNSRGSTDSPWQVVTTDQAPPDGVNPPIVTHIGDQLDALFITWNIPSKANGIIQNYQLQRNSTVPFSFQADDMLEYIDSGLRAYTWYRYVVMVCSGGGCTTSIPTLLRTKEAAPLYVAPPDVIPISSTAVRATWVTPQITNGNIKEYRLLMDGATIYTGLGLQHEEGGLIPYKEYAFILTACTDGGCMDSVRTLERPEEDVPLGLLVPVLRVMSSRSIDVLWQKPESPNGVITSYDIRRDGQLVYTESITTAGVLTTSYTDFSLEPGIVYSYVIIARNRKGSVESPASVARTYSASPSGMESPTLVPVSSVVIQVTWKPPVKPNGDIQNYTLYQGNTAVTTKAASHLSHMVSDLDPWTEYTFRIEACTKRGCELSVPAVRRTLEAKPQLQGQPDLVALANQDKAHDGVLVTWNSPAKPNGIIVAYILERRLLLQEATGSLKSTDELKISRINTLSVINE